MAWARTALVYGRIANPVPSSISDLLAQKAYPRTADRGRALITHPAFTCIYRYLDYSLTLRASHKTP